MALVAAVALFLQALFGVYANATVIGAGQLDAFGNPLCVSMPDENGATGKHDPAAMPACCSLACQAGATLLPLEPSGEALPAHEAWIAISLPLPRPLALARHAVHRPGNPRAPPLSA